MKISKLKYEIQAKYQNTKYTLKKPKYQNMTKFRDFPKISEIWCEGILRFFRFSRIFAVFSNRFRKILKNAALAVKFGVDTADILLFQIEKLT